MVVRMRHTRAHTANRRSHHGLSAVRLSTCQKCGALHRRHRACAECGTYRGREMQNIRTENSRNEERAKAKASRGAAAK